MNNYEPGVIYVVKTCELWRNFIEWAALNIHCLSAPGNRCLVQLRAWYRVGAVIVVLLWLGYLGRDCYERCCVQYRGDVFGVLISFMRHRRLTDLCPQRLLAASSVCAKR